MTVVIFEKSIESIGVRHISAYVTAQLLIWCIQAATVGFPSHRKETGKSLLRASAFRWNGFCDGFC